ncbi:MAG: nucleotide exchange factor GrpE [Psychrosphaera sp.]|nr:nucleotide exchange factor GrpE [Psychrosphaera sp.]
MSEELNQETVQAAPEATNTEAQPEPTEQAEQTEQVVESADTLRIAELEKALKKSEATVENQKDSVIRGKAEVENMRRRSAQDVEKAHKFALEKFASDLLPVLDNLERAIEFSDKENEAVKTVVEGIELTYQSFISSVEKFGMEVVDPQDETFNPDRHQAMSMQENAELKPNTVIAVMQKGYVLNGRLLRPAMVMVSKAPSEPIDITA